MRRKNRKGFTIVELVIVIAVIGILAAILIPTFVNIAGKAQQASNESFVRNINTQLAMNGADARIGRSKTMEDAVQTAQDMGFDVTKITPYNGNDIIWDQEADRFAIVTSDFMEHKDEAHVVYKDAATFDVNRENHKLWKIYSSMPSEQTYSIYAKEGWNTTAAVAGLKVGFDSGNVVGIPSIEFVGNGATQKEVLLRANGSTININADKASVNYYGFATAVDVDDVDAGTFHTHGTIGRLKYADDLGRIRFEDGSVTYCYMNKSADATADVSNTTKHSNAEVYTNVKSDGEKTVHEEKEVIVDEHNEVEVETCHNHNTEYDVITIGEKRFMVCKCCGGFTAYAENPTTHEIEIVDASPELIDEETGEIKEDVILPGPNTAFGFANSYKVEEGTANEHWVHEIETAEQFENIAFYIPTVADVSNPASLDAEKIALAQSMEYRLTADIDMSEVSYSPLLNATFIGTLNGNGKSITNYNYIDTGASGIGLIGNFYDKTVVKDLTIDYIEIEGEDFIGLLFGESWYHAKGYNAKVAGTKLTLSDITIGEHSIIKGTKGVAGVVGSTRWVETVEATNVTNKADVVASIYNAGGLFGTVSGVASLTMTGCKNYGNILAPANVAGLAGQGGPAAATVTNCENHGRITTYSVDTNNKTVAGWFIGQTANDTSNYTYEGNSVFTEGKVYYTSSNQTLIEGQDFKAIFENGKLGNGIAMEEGKAKADYKAIDDAVLMNLSYDEGGRWVIGEVPNAASYTISMQIYARDVKLSADEGKVTVTKERGMTYTKKFATPAALHDGFAHITRAGYVLNNVYTVYDYQAPASWTSTDYGRANFFRLPYAQRGNYDLGNIHFDTSCNEWVYVFDAQAGFTEGAGQILSPKDTYVMYVVSAYDASGHILAVGRHKDESTNGGSVLKNMAGEQFLDGGSTTEYPLVA